MSKCVICGDKFTAKYSTFEKHCENIDCKVKWTLEIVSKKKLKDKKEIKQSWKEKLILKDKLKTLTEWHNDLQKEINAIIREIDKCHPCISSQRPLGKSYDAGHLFGRQSNPHIRYHLFNIFAQSVHDNQYKSGNQLEFVDGIELTFGTEIKDYCLSLKGLPELKLTREEIKEKIPIARSILKWVKLQDRKFTITERAALRIKFNQEIGIYGSIKISVLL
jgi:hypothetical protein